MVNNMEKKMNSKAIIMLCSKLCINDIKPLSDSEWSKVMNQMLERKMQPKDLLTMSKGDLAEIYGVKLAERMVGLRSRSASLAFELNKYKDMGIRVVTVADKEYPRKIWKKLKTSSPPIFYYGGNIELCNFQCIGFVGSRNIDEEDLRICNKLVDNGIEKNYGVVSGGARGIDSISVERAIQMEGFAIVYAADSLEKSIKKRSNREAILNGKMVILSTTIPTAGFNVGMAMARNKYIYCQSKATVVIRTDFNKGGTWTGACEAIKKEFAPVYCVENSNNIGNEELIKMGAEGITEKWDVVVKELVSSQQISLFD